MDVHRRSRHPDPPPRRGRGGALRRMRRPARGRRPTPARRIRSRSRVRRDGGGSIAPAASSRSRAAPRQARPRGCGPPPPRRRRARPSPPERPMARELLQGRAEGGEIQVGAGQVRVAEPVHAIPRRANDARLRVPPERRLSVRRRRRSAASRLASRAESGWKPAGTNSRRRNPV